MIKLALRDVTGSFTRFIVTILSVVLGVAFLSGTLALRANLSDTLSQALSQTVSGTLHVEGKKLGKQESPRAKVPANLVDQIKEVDGVQTVRAQYMVPVTVLGNDDVPQSNGGGFITALLSAPTGFQPWTFDGPDPTEENDVTLEASYAKRLGKHTGDTLTFVIQGKKHEAHIVSTATTGKPITLMNAIMMPQEHLKAYVSDPSMVQSISIQTKSGADVQQVKKAVADKVGSNLDVRTTAQVVDARNQTMDTALAFATTLLLVFIVIALGVSTFIIANTFTMAVKARQKQYAYLRAAGASPGQIFATVALQALFIGVIGSAIGMLAGNGLLWAAQTGLEYVGLEADSSPFLSTRIIVISMIVGTLVTVVGAIIPARDAANTPPVEAMREVSGVREPSLVLRSTLGFIGIAAGLVCLWLGAKQISSHPGALLGVGSGALLLGVLAASPLLVKVIIGALGAPLRVTGPLTARLAVGNTIRNPRRTAATAGALFVGMALVAAGMVIVDSVRTSTEDAVRSEVKADLVISSQTGMERISDEQVDKISSAAGVGQVSADYQASLTPIITNESPEEPTPTVFLAANPDQLKADYNMKFTEGGLNALSEGKIAAPETFATTQKLKLGDELTVLTDKGPQKVTLGAITDSTSGGQSLLIDSKKAKDLGMTMMGRTTVLVRVAHGAKVSDVKSTLQHDLKDAYTLTVSDKADMVSQIGTYLNMVLGVLYALVGLSIVIAVLGILNTLGLSVSERAPEIALLKAIGYSRVANGAMITVEAVLTALYGTILGIAAGVACGSALVVYLKDSGISTLSVPWPTVGWVLLAAVGVGLVAAVLPAIRAANQPMLATIAAE